jgi:hypothetical protein
MRDCGTRQAAGDLVELVDRGANLGKRTDGLIGRRGLGVDGGNRPSAATLELGVH